MIADFLQLLNYVSPHDENQKVFSIKIYELILRSGTEFENYCKLYNGDSKFIKKKQLSATEYKEIVKEFVPINVSVGLLFWNPTLKTIQPFNEWISSESKLPWFDAYNNVKHNRSDLFTTANFENLVHSVSGLFLLAYKLFGRSFFALFPAGYHYAGSGTSSYNETIIPDSPFSVREYHLTQS
ncbi:MAG: hypothetical protein K9H61_14400 [Bacteroidia bacterium]|nr:hypothetical protein [Bacteroidia bacterium]